VTEQGVVASIEAETGSRSVEGRLDGRFVRFEVWHGDEPRLFTNPYYAQ
jgi:hypothetical protein